MLKTIISITLLFLYVHGTSVAAACGSAEAPCVQPDEYANIHTGALSTNLFKILPSTISTPQNDVELNQSRALLGKDSKVNAANSDQTDSLMGNNFRVSRPEKAPVDFYGINQKIDNDKLIGVYMRGKLPVADTFKLSGTVGYTHATLSTDQGREFANDSDLSYGVGTEFHMSEDLSLSVDYIQFIDRPQVEHTGLNLGLKGRF